MRQSSILVDACSHAESIGTIRSSFHVVVVEKFNKNVLTREKYHTLTNLNYHY